MLRGEPVGIPLIQQLLFLLFSCILGINWSWSVTQKEVSPYKFDQGDALFPLFIESLTLEETKELKVVYLMEYSSEQFFFFFYSICFRLL